MSLKASAELLRSRKNPFYLLESGKLTIRTKARGLERFVLNPEQAEINEHIKRFWYSSEPFLWLDLLKSRQIGSTTYFSALDYAIACAMSNHNGLVVAHDIDTVNYIFEMIKLFHEVLEETKDFPVPPLKKSNQKLIELESQRSSIRVNQAKNYRLGLTKTMHFVHLSEYAYYPYPRRLMANLLPSMPKTGKVILVRETTADGSGTVHHREWLQDVRQYGLSNAARRTIEAS